MPIVKMGWSDDERLIIITEYVALLFHQSARTNRD